VAQAKRDITATRERMTKTLDEMEVLVRDVLNWQGKVRERPLLYAGIALGVGFLLAGGPNRLIRRLYYGVRPSARDAALANQYTLSLKGILDRTLPGLPAGVAEQARSLRAIIEQTDPRARPDGTIIIEHKPDALNSALIRAAEVAATTAAAMLTKRLLDELDGGRKP
jgi:hypothetical protein